LFLRTHSFNAIELAYSRGDNFIAFTISSNEVWLRGWRPMLGLPQLGFPGFLVVIALLEQERSTIYGDRWITALLRSAGWQVGKDRA
jgi:hypothetical protein